MQNHFLKFYHNIKESELDADSHHSKLIALYRKYSDCVASNIFELGKVSVHEMTINLTDSHPVQCRPFRCSNSDRKVIRETFNELLQNKIICDSNSPYGEYRLVCQRKKWREKSLH